MADGSVSIGLSPRFRLFLLSRAVSWSGNAVTAVALPILLFQQTGSAILTGLLATCEALPYLLLGLPVGALVDRWDARRTMTVTSWASAGLTATVPLAAAVGPLHPVHLLVVATGLAVLFVFFDAASFGTIPALAGREGIADATARLTTVSTVIGIVGPPIGGVLTALAGAPAVLAADSASYAVGAVLLVRIRWARAVTRPSTRRSLATEIGDGVRYIWRTPIIRNLTLVGIGNSFTGGAVAGLVVVMAARGLALASDGWAVGLLFASGAVGTLIAARTIAPAQKHWGIGTITLTALAVNALSLAGYALSSTLIVAMIALLAWQCMNSIVSLNGIIVRQTITPESLQGRVNTTARMVAWGGQPFGAGIGGVLADAFGVRAALLIAASGVLVALAGGSMSSLRESGRLTTGGSGGATRV